MSIELDWSKLDGALATRLVDALNRTISNLNRPSFIGPVTVTALDFGTVAPDIEIIDVRDIYRDFVDDHDDEHDPAGGPDDQRPADEEDDFEWVSRRSAARATPAPSYHPFPPHLRYGPGPNLDFQNFFNGGPIAGIHSPTTDAWRHMQYQAALAGRDDKPAPVAPLPVSVQDGPPPSSTDSLASEPTPHADEPQSPNLQLHLYIRHDSDMRITVTTSLLINYPSPMFMALPIKLSVTGLIFTGQVVVAYEGARKRMHICIVDELDPYGPAKGAPSTVPTDKPLPIGQRLLPSIFIESEIGQADSHVLRNVTRVEKFMQEVIRKTIEDELVFPNFHTLVMGD
ncbi:hypothetical protein AURDEDRAFT_19733, partial [Auricularia subglabra TFB-10046 SS5]